MPVSLGSRPVPAESPAWTRIFKTADQTKQSDTTLAADSVLQRDLEAGTTYVFRFVVLFDTGTTPDFKYDLNYSGTLSGNITSYVEQLPHGATPGTAAATHGTTGAAIGSTSVTTVATSGRGRIFIEQTFTTDAAGTLAFRWAQDSSFASDTKVLAGSFLEYLKVVA